MPPLSPTSSIISPLQTAIKPSKFCSTIHLSTCPSLTSIKTLDWLSNMTIHVAFNCCWPDKLGQLNSWSSRGKSDKYTLQSSLNLAFSYEDKDELCQRKQQHLQLRQIWTTCCWFRLEKFHPLLLEW